MALLYCCFSSSLSSPSAIHDLVIELSSLPSRGFGKACFAPSSLDGSDSLAFLAHRERWPIRAIVSQHETGQACHSHTLHEHHEKGLVIHGDCCRGSLNEAISQLGPETGVATYASLLQRCITEQALSEGELVHELIIRYGYADNTFLNNVLIQMYSKCGSLQHARAVFDDMINRDSYSWTIMLGACAQNGSLDDAKRLFAGMPTRNVVSWNAMITVCAQNGHGMEALQLFDQMQAEGFVPNKVTFICLVDACASVEALEEGREIHASVVGNGCESDVVVGTALVNMYGKCGCVDDARAMFVQMPWRNMVSWSAMIAVCTQNGQAKESLQLFGQMQTKGFEPNSITFICVLDACASVAAIEEGREIHATVVGHGCESHVAVATALINMYGKCRSLDDARAVFLERSWKTVALWNAMMAVCAHNGHGKEALRLFAQMESKGLKPDRITFICILDACASIAALKEGREIHSSIISNGCESDVVVGTGLVGMYGKCGSLDDVWAVFVQLPQPNVGLWNAVITACVWNGQCNAALQLFIQMQDEGFEPNKITFTCALDACATMIALEEGLGIHASVVGQGWESTVAVGISLINMYGKCGYLDDARAVFVEMACKTMVSWSAMIAACAQNGHGEESLQLFGLMQAGGFKPNMITFTCILDTCASIAALQEGREIHAGVVYSGWESDVIVGTAIINMYGKCGSLDDARAVFVEMPQRNVVSWNAMISVCAQNGHGKAALELFGQMQADNIEPDEITFICVLTACSHMGLVTDGSQYFASMSQVHSLFPSVDHYACMIDLLGRAGQLDKAEQLINGMPFEVVTPAWSNLLACCRIHGDVERAVRAANHVFDLDEKNALPYILLSNIHAVAGRSDDVEKMR